MNTIRRVLPLVSLVLGACGGGAGAPTTNAPPSTNTEPSTTAATTTESTTAPSTEASAAPTTSASASAGTETAPPPVAALRALKGTVTAKGKPAANMVVYLEDGPKDPVRGMTATMDQKNMFFIPNTIGVTVGGTVHFLNSDPFPHNVFSMDGETFNMGTIAQYGKGKRTFNNVGSYTLLCNLHPDMIGRIVVVPSSYFAVTDKTGSYTIKDVPEGTYKVAVSASKMSKLTAPTQTITIKGGDATADFTLAK